MSAKEAEKQDAAESSGVIWPKKGKGMSSVMDFLTRLLRSTENLTYRQRRVVKVY